MNEEALKDSYKLFQETGYNGSLDEYNELINTNDEALADAYKLFNETGYNGTQEEFSSLVGVKKKVQSESEPMDGMSDVEESVSVAEETQTDGGVESDTQEIESNTEEVVNYLQSQPPPEEEFGELSQFIFPEDEEEFKKESIARSEEFEQDQKEERKAEEERIAELEDVTEEQINENITKVDENLEYLNESTERFNKQVETFNEQVEQGARPTEQEIKNLDIESTVLNTAIQAQLSKKEDLIKDRALKRSTKGTWTGAMAKEAIEGTGQLLEGTARLASYAPIGGGAFNLRDLYGDEVVNNKISKVTPMMEFSLLANSVIYGGFLGKQAAQTTQENIEKRYRDSDLQAATLSLAKTAPAMLTGTAGLVIQSAEMGFDMIDEAAGDKLTSDQKATYGAAYGIVIGSLERLGLLGTFANKTQAGKFANSVVAKMINNGEKFSKRGVERVVKELATPLLRGSFSEGGTEAAQEVATIGMESMVNMLTDDEIFNEPENAREALGRVWDGFRIGAIAGGMMGTLPAMYRAKKASVEEIKLARQAVNSFPDIIDYVDVKVKKGEITPEEGQTIKDQSQAALDILNEMPEDLSPENQAQAFGLLAEKKKLEQEIEGKDKNLVVNKTERIKTIDEQLQAIATGRQTTEQTKTEEDVQVRDVPVQEEVTEKTETNEEAQVEVDIRETTTQELDAEWASLDDKGKLNERERSRFNKIEKELEKRERDFILQAPLDEVEARANKLIEQEKNGDIGTFAELSELRDVKQQAEKYKNPSELTDDELKRDVNKALMGSLTLDLSDALTFREAYNELSKRGVSFEEMLSKHIDRFIKDGYSKQDALKIAKSTLAPILEGATQETKPKTEQDALQEVQGETEESVLRDEGVEETRQEEGEVQETQEVELTEEVLPNIDEVGSKSTVPITEDVEANIETIEIPDGTTVYSIEMVRDGDVIVDKNQESDAEFDSKEEALQHLERKRRGFKLAKQPKKPKDKRLKEPEQPSTEELDAGAEIEFGLFGQTKKGVLQPDGTIKDSETGIKYEIGTSPHQATIKENFQSAFSKGSKAAENYLNEIDKKLKKFGDETLGINIPVVVARAAVNAAKLAVKAGRTVSEAVDAMVNSVKESDWYKNLSQQEKKEAEAEAISLLNTPPQVKPNPEESIKKAKEAFQKSQDALNEGKKRIFEKGYIKQQLENFYDAFIDRQGSVKRALNKLGMRRALDALVNVNGASGYANLKYKDYHDKIYSDLSNTEQEALDEIIMLRRIIQIDSARDASGNIRVKHPDGLNKESAEAALEQYEKDLGDETYGKLLDRSKAYFDAYRDILKMSYDEGLIDKETYDKFKEMDYQPRKFVKYIFDPEVDGEARARQLQQLAFENGVGTEVIKSLADGSESEIFYDSRFLLQASLNSISKRISQNKANRKLAEDWESLSEQEKKENKDLFRKRKVVGQTNDGKPVFEKIPNGFMPVVYFDKGVKKAMLIRSDLYDQWYNQTRILPPRVQDKIATYSGTKFLKMMATGQNPLFIVGNVPMDYGHILLFTDAYDSAKVFGVPILPINALKLARDGWNVFSGLITKNKKTKDLLMDAAEQGIMMDFLSLQGKPRGGKLTRAVGGLKGAQRKLSDALSYLGEKSEMSFRLAVYQRQLKDMTRAYKKQTKKEPVGDVLEDMKGRAAATARNIIDFNQGGNVTKAAESVLPYLNAATQGVRVSTEYAVKNPRAFSTKLMQAMGFASGLAVANILMYGVDDWEDVPEWEKMRYFIYLLPFKDDDGNRKYLRVRKTPQAAPIFTAAETGAEQLLLSAFGEDTNERAERRMDRLIDSMEEVAPISPRPEQLLSRNPLYSAATAYVANYDLYRDKAVTTDFGEVLPKHEGYGSKRVENFYKEFGDVTGLSPARTQTAVEKIITSPTTNPLTGLVYTGLNSISGDPKVEKEMESIFRQATKGVEKKFVRSTYPEWKTFKQQEQVNIKKLENGSEKMIHNTNIRNLAHKYHEEKGVPEEVKTYINENIKPEQRKSYYNRYVRYKMAKDTPFKYFNIAYERDPEIQARLFRMEFGNWSDMDAEDKKQIMREFSKTGWKPTDRFILEMKRIEKEDSGKKPTNPVDKAVRKIMKQD